MILAEDITLSKLGDNRLGELDMGDILKCKGKVMFGKYRWIVVWNKLIRRCVDVSFWNRNHLALYNCI